MKILVINGSNRRHGNTDQITSLVIEHLERQAKEKDFCLDVERVYLGRLNLQFCRGCRICYDRGEDHCPVGDEILALKARMLAADGLILASPVYVDDVSALVKNMIDRLCHLCHRPQFAGKAAYLIATTGSSRTGRTLDTMKMALRTWGYAIAGQSGFKMGELMKPAETRSRFDRPTAAAAQKLLAALDPHRLQNPSFFALMVFKIQQTAWKTKGIPGTVDYRYWEEQGWFERGATYYISHRAGRVKLALARAAGRIIGKFMA